MSYDNYDSHRRSGRKKQQIVSAESGEIRQNLHLDDLLCIFRGKSNEDFEGGINCCYCGKLYKGRVCFTKHLWEHTTYWSNIEGSRHEKVLSLQAALILFANKLKKSFEFPVEILLAAPVSTKKPIGNEKTDI